MGLDMYLYRISRDLDGYRNVDIKSLDHESDVYKKLAPYIVQFSDGYAYLNPFEDVGYWRKANAIHKWFVDNIQGGNDDCAYYEVTKDKLEELLDICKKVVSETQMIDGKVKNGATLNKDGQWEYDYIDGEIALNTIVAEKLLPTTSGFFFGSTDYDQFYMADVIDTIDILTTALENTDFTTSKIYYSSSW